MVAKKEVGKACAFIIYLKKIMVVIAIIRHRKVIKLLDYFDVAVYIMFISSYLW